MSGYGDLAPYGLLSYDAEDSAAEVMYAELERAFGPAYSSEVGSVTEATLRARALALGEVKNALERAGAQVNPLDIAEELLPVREAQVSIVPSPGQRPDERRAAIAAKEAVAKGCARSNVLEQLQAALGTDFVAWRVTKSAEILAVPASPDNTTGLWVAPGVSRARKLFKLAGPVTSIGVPFTIGYRVVVGAEVPAPITVGERFYIDPGSKSRGEGILITAVNDDMVPAQITAVFSRPHDPGVLLTNQRFPRQTSNKQHSLVVVTERALLDPEARRKIHQVMRGVTSGVSTWSITTETEPGSGTTGPFRVGVGRIGITTIGEVEL